MQNKEKSGRVINMPIYFPQLSERTSFWFIYSKIKKMCIDYFGKLNKKKIKKKNIYKLKYIQPSTVDLITMDLISIRISIQDFV